MGKIRDYKGIVTGEALIGANIYKDIFSGVRDVVGGRTSAYEKELKNAQEVAISSMEKKARELSANAVISVNISYHKLIGMETLSL